MMADITIHSAVHATLSIIQDTDIEDVHWFDALFNNTDLRYRCTRFTQGLIDPKSSFRIVAVNPA